MSEDAKQRAMFATLLNVYHLTLPEIGRLTDAQIRKLYFHPRQDNGSIEPVIEVKKENTLESNLLMLEVAAAQTQMTAAELTRAKEELKARWKERHGD